MRAKKYVIRIFLIIIAIIVIFVFSPKLFNILRLLNMGIFEIENTFALQNGSINSYYMVCNPSNDIGELTKTVTGYIEKHDLFNIIKERVPSDYDGWQVSFNFYKPSMVMPIDWVPTPDRDIYYHVMDNLIARVHYDLNGNIINVYIKEENLNF